ncbi:hypothetical protein M408DRAFT_8308 [Serendipita vermifera MAFF 305830]|uniref:Uncharacterized protein n=1 Tax=Serendipita vermifera MAFF 305830 TaxID=933852 RepID=A0A0C3BCR8_SERVB|nr:hypothetical protein M408DRAFT_8308 [Serendipita vermifera MAFF 305830]
MEMVLRYEKDRSRDYRKDLVDGHVRHARMKPPRCEWGPHRGRHDFVLEGSLQDVLVCDLQVLDILLTVAVGVVSFVPNQAVSVTNTEFQRNSLQKERFRIYSPLLFPCAFKDIVYTQAEGLWHEVLQDMGEQVC